MSGGKHNDTDGDKTMMPLCQDEAGPGRARLQTSVESHPDAVRAAMGEVCAFLNAAAIGGEDAQQVELVLAEVLNNIVEHAYGGDEDGTIRMELTRLDRSLECDLTDAGAPMPGGDAPHAALARMEGIAPADLPEGGFGWGLIRKLTSRLVYTRVGNLNHLRFRIPLRGHGSGTRSPR